MGGFYPSYRIKEMLRDPLLSIYPEVREALEQCQILTEWWEAGRMERLGIIATLYETIWLDVPQETGSLPQASSGRTMGPPLK